jgi:hypothetical protein
MYKDINTSMAPIAEKVDDVDEQRRRMGSKVR